MELHKNLLRISRIIPILGVIFVLIAVFIQIEKNNAFKNRTQSQNTKVMDEILSYRLESKERVKQIQSALKNAGFYKGEADGKIGFEVKDAIKKFQKSKGLNPDGVVGSKTWEELRRYLKD